MSTQSKNIEELSEITVVEYLRQHPDFFSRHEYLLATMEISSKDGVLVPLQEQKLTELHEENQKLQCQLNDLITVAQKNEQLNQRIQRLVVALTGAIGIDEFFQTL